MVIAHCCSECGRAFSYEKTGPGRYRKTCSEVCRDARVQRTKQARWSTLPAETRARYRSSRRAKGKTRDQRRAANQRKQLRRRLLRAARPFTDLTPAIERALRAAVTHCPICGIELSEQTHRLDSKHLDHIVPLAIGGTHTRANVRIICGACNVSRPKDGSDLVGEPVALWSVAA